MKWMIQVVRTDVWWELNMEEEETPPKAEIARDPLKLATFPF
jgi:hypothetical protein